MQKENDIAQRITDWIGKSTVVNDDGTPKAVVHVSEWSGEGAFNKEFRRGGRLGKVFYFSEEPDFSFGRYAKYYYLKIEHPFCPEKEQNKMLSPEEVRKFVKAVCGVDHEIDRPVGLIELIETMKDKDRFGDAMQAIGYDGIIVDGIYGVFEPEQIMKAD